MSDPYLLTLLTEVQNSMGRLFNHRARHFGLTRPQWRVISGLYGNAGVTQTELAEIVSIARSPLGKIIDNLETNGLVERRADPDDRRVKRLHLMPAIEPVLEPTREIALALEEEVLADCSEEQQQTLRTVLLAVKRATDSAIRREIEFNEAPDADDAA